MDRPDATIDLSQTEVYLPCGCRMERDVFDCVLFYFCPSHKMGRNTVNSRGGEVLSLRKRLGVSQTKLLEVLGIGGQYYKVVRWERGISLVPADVLDKVRQKMSELTNGGQ